MPAMSKLPIKNGTPIGSVSLCKICINAQIMTGFRESELIAICDILRPYFVVPFNVYECTAYYDKNRPSWDEMKKLAIRVEPNSTLKPVGFKTSAGFTQTTSVRVGADDDEDEYDDD
jgi:hypothetical protein